MSRRGPLIFAVCLAVLGQVPYLSAQDITVLLIDIHSGQPVANDPLDIHFEDEHGAVPTLWFYAHTGDDGIVKLRVPQPTPSKITVIQRPDLMLSPLYACSIGQSLNTQELITHGIVLLPRGCPCRIGKQVSQITNTPGELVLFARHLSLWEELRAHLSQRLMM